MAKTKVFYITLTTLLSVVCIAGIILLSMPKVQANLIKNSNEYNEILDINSTQNDHISNLNGLIDDLNNQIAELKSNLSYLESEKNNFESLYNQGLISIEEKDNAILELNEEISSLNLEILTLEDQVNNLSLQLQSLYEAKTQLDKQIEELNNQISVLEAENQGLSFEINSLTTERQGYINQINQLTSQIDELTSQIEVLESENARLTENITTLAFERQEYINQVNDLNLQIIDLTNQIVDLQNEIRDLKNSVYQDAKFTTLDWVYAFNCVDNLGVQSTFYVGDYAEEATTTMHIEQIKFLLENYQTITYGSLCGLEVKIPLNNTLASTKIFVASDDKPTIDAGYKDTFSTVNHNVRLWNGSGYDFVNIDELSGFYNVRFSAQKYGTGDGNYILDLSFNLDLI